MMEFLGLLGSLEKSWGGAMKAKAHLSPCGANYFIKWIINFILSTVVLEILCRVAWYPVPSNCAGPTGAQSDPGQASFLLSCGLPLSRQPWYLCPVVRQISSW